jgi:hypothetical protein
MNLSKKFACSLLVVSGFLFQIQALAQNQAQPEYASHEGKVELTLSVIDAKGRRDKVASQDLDFALTWKNKNCEIRLKHGRQAYCKLDTSRDLVNANGELVMKNIPQAHFSGETIGALISLLGKEDRKFTKMVDQLVRETAIERATGFDLPFYSCATDCLQNGNQLQLNHVFKKRGTEVTREISLSSLSFRGQRVVFSMTLKDMVPHSGAFDIIGNNNAGNFGR